MRGVMGRFLSTSVGFAGKRSTRPVYDFGARVTPDGGTAPKSRRSAHGRSLRRRMSRDNFPEEVRASRGATCTREGRL